MDHKKYAVLWVRADALFDTKTNAYYGPCGYSQRCAMVVGAKGLLKTIVVQDVIVDEQNRCEEAHRCLDRECKLNRATDNEVLGILGLKKKSTSLDIAAPMRMNRRPEVQARMQDLLARNPNDGVITRNPRVGER